MPLLCVLRGVGVACGRDGRLLLAAAKPQNLLPSCRGITHKSLRGDPDKKPPPWPYKEKGYWRRHQLVDFTTKRFDENSKLIIVEGNIGSGKSTLARELAEHLDFYFMPEFTMDDILINGYGVDRRDFYHMLPESCRIPDLKMFYENPKNPQNCKMQDMMFYGKCESYMNALAHIMNTGQGVVMERSPFSDFAFVNAMRKKELITPEYFRIYHVERKAAIPALHFWPHLVIYLDVPVPECMDRIKKRGIPYENNGKVIDYQYLDTIQESYKDMLKEASRHSHMLIYDWSKIADTDQVVEDIEKLDLDFYEWHSGEVLEEWNRVPDGFRWNDWRFEFTRKYFKMAQWYDKIDRIECEELFVSPEDDQQFFAIMKKFVMGPYAPGFNRDKGDPIGPMLWKNARKHVSNGGEWYDHYWRDAWWSVYTEFYSWHDVKGDKMYDPDYLHH